MTETAGRAARLLVALALPIGLAACGGEAAPLSPQATPTGQPFHATVDVRSAVRTVDSGEVLGGNLGLWVLPAHLASPVDSHIADRGARLFRYPGGQADQLCWQTMRVKSSDTASWDFWSWATNVDDYVAFLRRVGGRPLVGLNFFDHTIDGQFHDGVAEARALVRHLVTAGFPGACYELGNELDWNASVNVDLYTERFVAYAEAVKSVDPTARMAGPVTSSLVPSWRDGFIDGLAARGKIRLLDVFAFHYYGGWFASWNADTIDLAKPQVLGNDLEALRQKLAAAGAPAARIAVTEYNAGIWDKVTRGQGSIQQALWLADACGELFDHADMATIWVELSAVTDHALLDDSVTPASRTTNYWPMLLAGQTLGFGRHDPAVSVLAVSGDLPTSRATIHAVRAGDGRLGILLVNKGEALSVEIALANRACSAATGRRIDEASTGANSAPVTMPVTCQAGALSLEMPRLSAVGVVLD